MANVTCVAALLTASVLSTSVQAFDIIAHRGASGYLPEHTLEAATLAFAQQPDYIEQDVVITEDKQAVVLHDIHLETVTNVEQMFPDRAREDGRWYALDFTLAELKTLQVHERQNADGSPVFKHRYSGKQTGFTVATLDEHIELITQLNRELGTDIGLYTEIKSPAWHHKQGVDIASITLKILARHNLTRPDVRFVLQCFDFKEVQRIRQELGYEGMLVQLVGDNSWGEAPTDYNWLLSKAGLKAVAQVADGLGPWLPQLMNKQQTGAASWVKTAQQQGLILHPYTYRADALPKGMSSDALMKFLTQTVDGVFTDQVPPVKNYLKAHPVQ